MHRFLRGLGSLHMAVPLLIAIAGVLAWGTIYETRYGTAAVQRFIYQAWWFQALLAFLAVNLAVAAFERWPWKQRHTPFLLAHLGIILILVGGIIGGRFGIDGQLIIPEGQANKVLQLPQNVLVVRQPNPGTTQVIPTRFETTAWNHEPHALFRIPHDGDDIQLVVDRYYPDSVLEETVTNDGNALNPAVQVVVSHAMQEERVWLFANDPERFGVRWGDAHLLFMEPSAAELEGVFGLTDGTGPARGTLHLDLPDGGGHHDVAVPDAFGQPVPIDGTPYVLQFKDYFSDFGLTEQGITNRSAEPNNPAVSFTVTGPEGTESFLAFALHPDFDAMHGRQRKFHVGVAYHHGVRPSVPPNTIAIVRHPSGALTCLLTGPGAERHLAACTTGTTYTHPWLDYQFTLLAAYASARVTPTFVSRGDELKAEALHIVAQQGEQVADGWVGLRGTIELPLGGKEPMTVEYRPAQRELPFTVKLIDFRKIEYPGTTMAAGFESDVQISDMERGIILMRKISMNNPFRYRGYSMFQSSYVPGDPETTILSVRNDPGTPFVYAGFLIVIGGVVAMFVLRARSTDAAAKRNGEAHA